MLINLCSRSSWSLRRPTRVAKTYYAKELISLNPPAPESLPAPPVETHSNVGEEGENVVEEVGAEPTKGSSFFAYEPHNFLHKFFESRDLLMLERRFAFYRRLDVAKCFNNIYTHSLSWAIKGKAAAKLEKQARHTFDGILDNLMQRSNHGETHGILIGSEISRIFAEIIFQAIDVRVEANYYETRRVAEERDFSVRRYIDDYFIFQRREGQRIAVQDILELELADYNLFIYEKKKMECRRPSHEAHF